MPLWQSSRKRRGAKDRPPPGATHRPGVTRHLRPAYRPGCGSGRPWRSWRASSAWRRRLSAWASASCRATSPGRSSRRSSRGRSAGGGAPGRPGRSSRPASPTSLPAAILASDTGLALTARRVGIAPAASCAAVTDGAAARALARFGCSTVLRATYADATGAFIITVGVAVLPGARAATAAAIALSGSGSLRPGVRAAVFPGTLAEWSGDRARQVSLSISAGPYVVMSAAGYADGRPRAVRADGNQYGRTELLSAAKGIAGYVAGKIGAKPPPPLCPGAPGC